MTVNILGVEYTIIYKSDKRIAKDVSAEVGQYGGYCNAYKKEIVIAKQNTGTEDVETKEAVRKRVLRHEITHAFLHESGLYEDSLNTDAWAMNEEMVDWIALQFPKMLKAFRETGAM